MVPSPFGKKKELTILGSHWALRGVLGVKAEAVKRCGWNFGRNVGVVYCDRAMSLNVCTIA